MYFCYILKSQKDSRYYFGFTSDIDQRLKKHNAGDVQSTKHRRPMVLHYFEQFENKSEALKREKFFKSFQGRQWLHANAII